MNRTAKANVNPVRQRTQYSCMSASMTMCLRALDHDVTEDEVNRVMGARPMKGAAWEQALACAQHYGCRATLTMPSTVEQLKAWTDAGVPIMIAWNPEGRPWSHASVVFHVDDDLNVHVADPNIPNPKKTVRVVSEDDFYGKWYEKFPDYLVRRPACAIEREITVSGENVRMASKVERCYRCRGTGKGSGGKDCWTCQGAGKIKKCKECKGLGKVTDPRRPLFEEDCWFCGGEGFVSASTRQARGFSMLTAKKKKKPQSMKTRMKVDKTKPKTRNDLAKDMAEGKLYGGGAAGTHHNRKRDVAKGRSRKQKHKKDWSKDSNLQTMLNRLAAADEKLFDRAAMLLQYMNERAALKELLSDGVSRQDAFLAVKAGKLLNESRMKRRSHQKRASRVRDNSGRWWGPKQGLEGPFKFKGGEVLYYDPHYKGGTYYDPTTDMYLSHADASRIHMRTATRYRKARRADYFAWQAQVPGSEVIGSKEQKALSAFWDFCQGELVEAVHLDDALEMVAWDMGYQGRSLRFAPGLEFLAKIRRKNLRAEYKIGQEARQHQRAEAKYAATHFDGFDGFDDFDDDDDDEWYNSPEYKAKEAFERLGKGYSRMEPLKSPDSPFRSVPSGIGIAYYYLPKTTSRKHPMLYVFGDTDKAGAARLARALFKGRIPITKRRYSMDEVYYTAFYIGLSDGTLAKFIPPEGLVYRRKSKYAGYKGNPDGKDIYPVEVDHGEEKALSGGFDIMQRLQERYLAEQGHKK